MSFIIMSLFYLDVKDTSHTKIWQIVQEVTFDEMEVIFESPNAVKASKRSEECGVIKGGRHVYALLSKSISIVTLYLIFYFNLRHSNKIYLTCWRGSIKLESPTNTSDQLRRPSSNI